MNAFEWMCDFCLLISEPTICLQASSIFLAMILRFLGPDRRSYYDSDDDYTPARLPLLKSPVQQSPYAIDSHFTLKNNTGNVRINVLSISYPMFGICYYFSVTYLIHVDFIF